MQIDSQLIDRAKDSVARDHPDVFRALVEEHPELKAVINDPIASFDSPLINHVRSRAMLDALLAAGADINAESRWWAGSFSLLDVAEPQLAAYAIERGAVVDVHAAARLGMRERLVELISSHPESVHARGGDGQTPLHFASTVEIAEFLLSRGAAIDARDIDHESTPAQWMIRDRQPVVRYLIQRGALSDLVMTAALGDAALVQQHLEADPNCVRLRVSERSFPKRNPRSGGSIYNWTLGRDYSAHKVAHEFGHQDIFRVLMENSPIELQLTIACELGDESRVRSLLAANPGVAQSLTPDDCSQIAHAARDGKLEAVRLMIAAGWSLAARGQHGATPLHWAAFHGNIEMVTLILSHNPPLDAIDADHAMTPLAWANYGAEHGWHRKTGNYAGTIDALQRALARANRATPH